MFEGLVNTASRLLTDFHRVWLRESAAPPHPHPAGPALQRDYQPLERVLLTDGVGRTLFDEYADHRATARGDQETGWMLLGLREGSAAVVLATLPAGTDCDASVTHIRLGSSGQALGSRIVRQIDRRLTLLGVFHTHPGSLRHPSDADFQGDSQWVRNLRGKEGIFGIGTADGDAGAGALFAEQPRPHVQCLGGLCLSWYSLKFGEPSYRPLTVGLTIGPDLARPLHAVWRTIETHAERLERLFRQQAGVTFEVVTQDDGSWLAVNVPVAVAGLALRVLMRDKEVRYFLTQGEELLAVDCPEERVDRGVYLLLAELAAQG